ncbi:MAG: hypothetical protein WCS70_12580 [Verrucomicrobiota bacterium]
MKKNQTFDCVQMKTELQQQLRQTEAGLTLAERKQRRQAKLLADPVLGAWFHMLKARPDQHTTVAESPAKYRSRKSTKS